MKKSVFPKFFSGTIGLMSVAFFLILICSVSTAQVKKGTGPAKTPAKTQGTTRPGGTGQATKPATTTRPQGSGQSRPATTQPGKEQKVQPNKPSGNTTSPSTRPQNKVETNKTQNNTNINRGGNNINSGNTTINNNNVNIDRSKNVNVNVNNSRNVVVRPPYKPYTRPPYSYGGHRYYAHHPYHYHSYHAHYWGPAWHPWGFLVATLAVTAIVISVNEQKYHYDQGVYYVQSSGGYTVVQAPVGATVTVLPEQTEKIVINEVTNNYYYGGTFYEKSDGGYTVVAPVAGTLVPSLPEGGEEVKLGEITYVKIGDVYYQPVKVEGKEMYEVVQVEKDESKN
jgi:hypothetical protein